MTKKVKLEHQDASPNINHSLNKTYTLNKTDIVEHPNVPIYTCDLYEATPVSRKSIIKHNILKDTGNKLSKVPVMMCRKKLDVLTSQDDSTNSLIKFPLPSVMPLVTASRHYITFDDLHTDDEDTRGLYPKWSLKYKKSAKIQSHVYFELLEQFFTVPFNGLMYSFPATSNLNRNESSVWATSLTDSF